VEEANNVFSTFFILFDFFSILNLYLMKSLMSLVFVLLILSCTKEEFPNPLTLVRYRIEGIENNNYNGSKPDTEIRIDFSAPIDINSAKDAVKIYGNSNPIDLILRTDNKDSTLIINPGKNLKYLTKYFLFLDNSLKAKNGIYLDLPFQASFTTEIDIKDKFPLTSDEELLDKVQRQTFKYFWDFGHPISGLSRERNSSGDLVTSGGSGFGIMSIIVGIERGFITRQQGIERLLLITDFLLNKTDRFHGVFPHWFNGVSGKTIPFSTKDNGGDLVETSYLLAGLLSAKEYFDRNDPNEGKIRQHIKDIWETVEWSWHTKNDEKVLYWHWSPNYQWEMNHQIRGYNEALITYILAASSPTYSIDKDVYTQGWARNGGIKNGKSFYAIKLPLGYDFGGPLFFAHYSFLGIDPNGLSDEYADYHEQVVSHSKINHAYCASNPRNYYGYSNKCWGLTASDSNSGYSAHSPTNDLGVISPTAALSSLPYTPEESMDAIRYFYYTLGDRTFKEYGFIDAFNLHNLWFANSFLAIDQGPIVVMIENHRSQLIWKLLMKNDDVKNGLKKLGFQSSKYNF
jgi:hypothetical protein